MQQQPLGGSADQLVAGLALGTGQTCGCSRNWAWCGVVWDPHSDAWPIEATPERVAAAALDCCSRPSSIFASPPPRPPSPQGALSIHHAQDIQLHRLGSARLGEDDALGRLPLLEDEPRDARHSSHQAPCHGHERPARHPARHAGQSVLQCALCLQSGRPGARRHHVGEPGSKSPLDTPGRHGRGHAHTQAACPRTECRQPTKSV